MKKLLFLLFLLFPSICYGGFYYSDATVVGETKVTGVNTHLSTIDGTAFVDLIGEDITAYNGYKITITDPSGYIMYGYIGDDGTGETLGSEKLTDGDFENWKSSTDLTSWTEGKYGTTSIDQSEDKDGSGSYAVALTGDSSNSSVQLYQSSTNSVGQLYYLFVRAKASTTSKSFVFYVIGVTPVVPSHTLTTSYADYSVYVTIPTADRAFGVKRSTLTSATAYFDHMSVKQVTAPSATGATIVTTPGGATQNFTYKNSNFVFNNSGYYKYRISR